MKQAIHRQIRLSAPYSPRNISAIARYSVIFGTKTDAANLDRSPPQSVLHDLERAWQMTTGPKPRNPLNPLKSRFSHLFSESFTKFRVPWDTEWMDKSGTIRKASPLSQIFQIHQVSLFDTFRAIWTNTDRRNRCIRVSAGLDFEKKQQSECKMVLLSLIYFISWI